MFPTTLKIILRNLYLDRLYALINIAGLSIGFCSFLVIFLYLRSELTVDQHFDNHERIYRLTSEVFFDGVQSNHAKVGSLAGPLLAQDYEGFSRFVRLNPVTVGDSLLVLNGDIGIQWDDFVYDADNSVFDVFSHTILAGDPATALTEPRRLAISESVARLFFGDEDPIGKTLALQVAANTYAIDLVFADLPANTSLKYDILISYTSNRGPSLDGNVEEYFEQGIVLFHNYTYFLLPENFDHAGFADISAAFFARYAAGPAARMFPGQNANMDLKLQPLDEIYFAPFMDEDVPKGNRFNVYVLASVAVFILLVACINYMNLATARYAKRAREVGVRRTLGADRYAVVAQFLLEGLAFALLALLVGISMVELLASSGVLANLLGQKLDFALLSDPGLALQMLAVGITVGLLSGLFPAVYFASVRPIDVFRPVQSTKTGGIRLRGLLVGIQMLVSVGVVASAALMTLQIQFLNSQPLGFDSENKLDIFAIRAGAQGSDYRALVERLAAHPDVRRVSMSDYVPGTVVSSSPVLLESEAGGEINAMVNALVVDEHYLETLGIELLGLVGLTAFMLEQRTKEIGIRKVLGASSLRIMTLLFSRIFLLIAGAAALASVAVYYVVGGWLQGFAYRVEISPLVFVFAAAVVLLLAGLTVVLQAFRVTQEKPARALRYE